LQYPRQLYIIALGILFIINNIYMKAPTVTLDSPTQDYVKRIKERYPRASTSQIIALLAKKGASFFASQPTHVVAEELLK